MQPLLDITVPPDTGDVTTKNKLGEPPDTLYVDQRNYALLRHNCGRWEFTTWLMPEYRDDSNASAAMRVYGMHVFSVIDHEQHIAVLRRQ